MFSTNREPGEGREMIKRKYSLVVDGDESGYSPYTQDLPTIVVRGGTG